MNVLGLMSGTSIDGVDFVLCRATKQGFRFVDSATKKFPPLLKKRLRKAALQEVTMKELIFLDNDLGSFYAKVINEIKIRKSWKIDLIGLHGQTVFHKSGVATCQIGEPSYIARKLEVPVVSDFRKADIASGGQGAPLAGIFHKHLADSHKLSNVSFHNLGGISNITYLNKKEVISFDTGPANMLMDLFCEKYVKKAFDKNGSIAARGLENANLINDMLKHPYFKKKAPKTCGREDFGEVFFKKYEKRLRLLGHKNALATLCHFTALSIAKAYKSLLPRLPDEIILCGGGAKNKHLAKVISFYLPDVEVVSAEALSWQPQNIEGGAFAYLAYLNYKNKKIDMTGFTGSKEKIILGKLTK